MENITRFTNNSKHMGPFPFSMHVWPYAKNAYGLLMREQFDTKGKCLNCKTEHKFDKELNVVYDEVRQITKPSEIHMLMRRFWHGIYNQHNNKLIHPYIPRDLPIKAQLVCHKKDNVSYIPFYISQTGRLINNIGEITNNPFRFQYENQIDRLEFGPIIIDRIENSWLDNAWLYWRRLKQDEIMVDKKMNQIWPLDDNVGKFPIAMIDLIRGYSLSK